MEPVSASSATSRAILAQKAILPTGNSVHVATPSLDNGRTTRLLLKAIAPFLLASLAVVWGFGLLPVTTAVRSLTQAGDVVSHGMGGVIAVPSAGSVVATRVYVSPDPGEDLTPVGSYQQKAFSYRYPTTISFPMATYTRVNTCQVWLTFDDLIASDPVDCHAISDNSMVVFKLSAPLRPGDHRMGFHWRGIPGHDVAIYGHVAADGGLPWVIPWSGPATLHLHQIIGAWILARPVRASLYLLSFFATIFLGGLFVVGQWRTRWLVPLVGLTTLVLLFSVSPPYVGFDETAHIDMLHHQLSSSPDGDEHSFWDAVRVDMIRADFHRLNNGALPASGACPHTVVGGCGATVLPQNLYHAYAVTLGRLVPASLIDLPQVVRRIALAANIVFIVCLALASATLGGIQLLSVLVVTLVFYGGAQSQLPTVTNDVPMILYGLYLAALGVSVIIHPQRWIRHGVGYIVGGLLYAVLSSVDRGIHAALPVLIALPPAWALAFWAARSKSEVGSCVRGSFWRLVAGPLFFFGAAALICISVKMALETNLFDLHTLMVTKVPDGGLIDNMQKFRSVSDLALGLWLYFKSLFGSFVWGHSYYHDVTYAVHLVLFVIMTAAGCVAISSRARRAGPAAFLTALLATLAAAQVCLILSVMSVNLNSPPIMRDSFLKSRLTAPGIAGLLIVPMVGIYTGLESKKWRPVITAVTIIWALVLTGYYLPKFFLADPY